MRFEIFSNQRPKSNLLFHRSSLRCTLLNGQLNIVDRREHQYARSNQRRFNPLDYNSSARVHFLNRILRFTVLCEMAFKKKVKGTNAADQNNLFCAKYKIVSSPLWTTLCCHSWSRKRPSIDVSSFKRCMKHSGVLFTLCLKTKKRPYFGYFIYFCVLCVVCVLRAFFVSLNFT